MTITLMDAERQQLRALQKQRRDDGYVKVTVVLMLDAGRSLAIVAQDLGLDETTVYRTCGPSATWAWRSTWPTNAPATGGC